MSVSDSYATLPVPGDVHIIGRDGRVVERSSAQVGRMKFIGCTALL